MDGVIGDSGSALQGGAESAPLAESAPKRKRILYFDLLTIAACFAVVALHCNGLVHSFKPSSAWGQSLAVEVLFFWAVPVFFMLTGANNMGYRKKRSTKEFLLRRARRLLVPFVAWSLIAYLYYGFTVKGVDTMSVFGFAEAFMNNTIVPIYWFFFAIISLTLAMPVLSLLADNKRVLWYIVAVQFLLGSVLPFASNMLEIPWSTAFELPVANTWVMYAILGYLLANTDVPKKWRALIYVLAIAAFVLRYIYTYVGSYDLGATDRTLFDYGAFTGVLPAVAVFLMFKYINWDKTILAKHAGLIASISGCAFGVYLIHIFILNEVVLGYFGLQATRLFVRAACPFIIFGVSLAIVAVLRKIPVVKEIIP